MILAIWVFLYLTLTACTLAILLYIQKYYKYWEKRKVPIESNFFLANNIYSVFSGKLHFGKFLIELYQSHPEDPYFGFYILGKPYLFIRCPNIIKGIGKNHQYFQDRSFFCDEKVDPVVSKSLFIAKNPGWRDSRQKLSTLFSPAKFKAMVPMILSHCEKMNIFLKRYNNHVINVQETAENLMTNVLPHIFLGIDSQCEYNTNDNVIKEAIKNMFGKGWYQGVAFFLYAFVPKLVGVLKCSLLHDDFIKTIVKDVIESYKDTRHTRGTRVIDTLANLDNNMNQKTKEYFDENWLVAQSSTLAIAAFVPTSSFFALSLYELSLNQECQEKLREEIFEHIRDENFDIYDRIMEMKYLNMVVAEVLRIYPLGDFVNRNCNRDYVIEATGLRIEKGTPIMISINAMHTDPKFYPDPFRFDPERFKNGTKELENAGVYLPFGCGQRRCLGERFAPVVIKIALVEVLRKFKFEPCNETERPVIFDSQVINTSPLNGVKLRIYKL
ncbi:unnamed protein product [Ceutorhynchus assimilis]|uniref:Cytochrome P450 n=1 Tax=Ceutorhynchus assimilis TaxID=467358 RepID=A0A9N9MQ48_9CUCU|nr:unnamed protein product [Ceutorhynchus assimilis]